MADLLLELFSEEIPSGMQARAAQDLARLVGDGLKEAGIEFGETITFYGARRLTLAMAALPDKSADVSEERKGPRVGSPDKAIEGFLRGAGLESIDQAEIVSDEKKGDFYVARIEKPGRATAEIIAEIVPAVIRSFPWPKSQRWGAGKLRWVRPLHSILCLLGGKVVPFEVEGIASSNETRGHRFMSEGAIQVSDFAGYEKKLRAAHVILNADERQKIILNGAQAVAKKAGLDLVEDEALLAEAAGLVEWPVVLMGAFDEEFLDVPPEVIITAIKKHQKCFSLTGMGGKLANNFILVANIEAEDGGKAIIDGNERVIRARLSDAKFFWDQDRKIKLEDRLPALSDIIFHEKLGTQAERVERIGLLADHTIGMLCTGVSNLSSHVIHGLLANAKKAAKLCKADLVTGMVGEFPDLQGLMGKYYALDQGEDASVALAIEEHYKPVGQSDSVPTSPVSIAVALSDKLDSLVGFFGAGLRPTGSRDPYALRRAALGFIRIVLDNKLRIDLATMVKVAHGVYSREIANKNQKTRNSNDLLTFKDDEMLLHDLQDFFADRLKVFLKDNGARHDFVDAVLATYSVDNLYAVSQRVEALNDMLSTREGQSIREGVKRATNILRIEEKKEGTKYIDSPDQSKFILEEEKNLFSALEQVKSRSAAAIERGRYTDALMLFEGIASHVDAFFDNVTVNVTEGEKAKELRENRLKLLNQIREATLAVADFSKIEG